MTTTDNRCRVLREQTAQLAACPMQFEEQAASPFEAAQQIVRRLGAHLGPTGAVELGFWAPELGEQDIPDEQVKVEIFTALTALDLQKEGQEVTFRRELLPVQRSGDYVWSVVEGMQVGTAQQVGSFYWLTYQDAQGNWQNIADVLAYSVPFGAFAPAELYDIRALDEQRADREYFAALAERSEEGGIPKIGPVVNMLQVHIGTASEEGTLAGLTRIYQRIAQKIEAYEALTPLESCYIAYEAVQLMPIEPIIEYEAALDDYPAMSSFWQPSGNPLADTVEIALKRPDMTNWGYDIVISASSAINPVILQSGRPDELVEFAATLHNFPTGPIKLIFDVVFGHADNQALKLLNPQFFTGPNMYGQDMNYQHPVVRAIMLEMQRRKMNFGADGLRVDGAQDFKYWDAEAWLLRHDDEYLQSMSDIVQEVAGQAYQPWMIFEDGRPWPRADWELASSYRDVIEQQPDCFQWGPLIFAHNTNFLQTFWINKWWRVQEVAQLGSHWISGYANHDTVRRSTQVDPNARLNRYLGDSFLEILKNSCDHAAATLLTYAFLPGVPMDFINATTRTPWSFIRNTDERYGIKVVSEEAAFLDWQVNETLYKQKDNFCRLKELGFRELAHLRDFMRTLAGAVELTSYELNLIVSFLAAMQPSPIPPNVELTLPYLKAISRAWMDDVHDYSNVTHHAAALNPTQTQFNLAARRFRLKRPWLAANLREGEYLERRHPANGSVLFYGLRQAPDSQEQILFVGNMEGLPASVMPTTLPIPGLAAEGWELALASPGLVYHQLGAPVTLHNSDGLVLIRR